MISQALVEELRKFVLAFEEKHGTVLIDVPIAETMLYCAAKQFLECS